MRRTLGTLVGFMALAVAVVTGGPSPSVTAAGLTGPSGVTYEIKRSCASNRITVIANVAGIAANPWDVGVRTVGSQASSWTQFGQLGPGQSMQKVTFAADASATSEHVLIERTASGWVDVAPIPSRSTTCPTISGSGGTGFVPMTPTRVLDTRPESPVGYSGPIPAAGQQVAIPIAGRFTVPSDARAVVANVTIVGSRGAGFVQVLPGTAPTGIGTWSNVNTDRAGQTVPNGLIAPLGADGSITLYTDQSAHLLVDIAGYFVDPVGATGRIGRFVASSPARRVLDTRNGIGYTGAKPVPGQTVNVGVVRAGDRVPIAVAVNLTAVDATDNGFVQTAAGGTLVPGQTSSVNAERGQTVPNFVIVPVAADGTIDVYTAAGAHLLVDVLGRFTDEPAVTGGLFVPVTPERILDTRPDSALGYLAQSPGALFPVQGPGITVHEEGLVMAGLPANTGAVMVNVTATASGSSGFLQIGATVDGSTSNLNLDRADQTVANSAVTTLDQFSMFRIYTQNRTHLLADVFGFFTR